MTTLDHCKAMARRYKDADGKEHCVLNFNRVGVPLYVVREFEGPDAYKSEGPRFVVWTTLETD